MSRREDFHGRLHGSARGDRRERRVLHAELGELFDAAGDIVIPALVFIAGHEQFPRLGAGGPERDEFLADVLGVRRVACEAVAQIENAPRVSPHEFLPGRPFAPETLLYQLSVGLQSFSASQHASPFGLTYET